MGKLKSVLPSVLDWLGVGAPLERRNSATRRNMIVVACGSGGVIFFAAMLSFCLLTGTPCPIDGFDEAVRAKPDQLSRYQVFCPVLTLVLAAVFVYAIWYLRSKRCHPREALVVTMICSLAFVMLWGISESGRPAEDQVLIFSSIQFLTTGLIVFTPLASIIYFTISFSLFSFMLNACGLMGEHMAGELVYLYLLNLCVSWAVYSLHRRGVLHEQRVADMSRRDELTGAKNRHYLRDDFPTFVKRDLFIMLCDIDNFKHFNDDYDHATGDYLLREFFFVLREEFGDECTYRYGGDEFLVITPDFSEGEFRVRAQKARDQLAGVKIDGVDAGLTYSGGYVWGSSDEEGDYRKMLHAADRFLMMAKQSGKDRVVGERFSADEPA